MFEMLKKPFVRRNKIKFQGDVKGLDFNSIFYTLRGMANVDLIPILDDNYVFLIKTEKSSDVILVDPGESQKCLSVLSARGLNLVALLITHHHNDHIDGIVELKEAFPNLKVYAPLKNKNEIASANYFVEEGVKISIGEFTFEVLELPGHTLGIVGYFEPQQKWLFSGDVLFGLGVGRLFEGTPQILFESLSRVKALPPETLVFCTHEYTSTNVRFTEKLLLENKVPRKFNRDNFARYKRDVEIKRAAEKPTVPLVLRAELLCNIFLIVESSGELGELRRIRNGFR